MSILIKGMEMPKSCSDCFAERCIGSDFGCDILGFDDANTTCFTRERRKDCPLIAVPPHGRLIDADCCNDYFYEHMSDDMMIAAMNAINEMPTIIESDNE